jgi:hypothetical protein
MKRLLPLAALLLAILVVFPAAEASARSKGGIEWVEMEPSPAPNEPVLSGKVTLSPNWALGGKQAVKMTVTYLLSSDPSMKNSRVVATNSCSFKIPFGQMQTCGADAEPILAPGNYYWQVQIHWIDISTDAFDRATSIYPLHVIQNPNPKTGPNQRPSALAMSLSGRWGKSATLVYGARDDDPQVRIQIFVDVVSAKGIARHLVRRDLGLISIGDTTSAYFRSKLTIALPRGHAGDNINFWVVVTDPRGLSSTNYSADITVK